MAAASQQKLEAFKQCWQPAWQKHSRNLQDRFVFNDSRNAAVA
jgi:hypothetical protein